MIQWFNKKMSKKRKGFTLIELIVVIAILGILAALAIPRFAGTQTTAKNRAHNANVRTIESAVSLYMAETGTEADVMDDIEVLIDGYLKENPTDPRDNNAEAYSIEDGVVSPEAVPMD